MSGGVVSGDGGDDGVRRLPWRKPWRKPWRRSVGFWLGAWVLAFLVWVWVDSFSNAWKVESMGWVRGGKSSAGPIGQRMVLHAGKVTHVRVGVDGETAGTTTFMRRPRFDHGGGGVISTPTAWGADESVDLLRILPDRLALRTTRVWFPFAVVVAGYVVVWACLMMWWRRWMRRRWEKGLVVEG